MRQAILLKSRAPRPKRIVSGRRKKASTSTIDPRALTKSHDVVSISISLGRTTEQVEVVPLAINSMSLPLERVEETVTGKCEKDPMRGK